MLALTLTHLFIYLFIYWCKLYLFIINYAYLFIYLVIVVKDDPYMIVKTNLFHMDVLSIHTHQFTLCRTIRWRFLHVFILYLFIYLFINLSRNLWVPPEIETKGCSRAINISIDGMVSFPLTRVSFVKVWCFFERARAKVMFSLYVPHDIIHTVE